MDGSAAGTPGGRTTRAGLLHGVLAGGAAIAAGAAIGRRPDSVSEASPSKSMDRQIFGLFLLLERVQRSFYDAARVSSSLQGELLRYAEAAAAQERQHVTYLEGRAGRATTGQPRDDFGDAVRDAAQFRRVAVDLEEAVIAAYIGQGANMTHEGIAAIAPLVSVEARQAAWIRDLAGVSPAPRAADPAREPEGVLADLRERGFIL
jgi:hypothetical protein